ncbi:MAG: hypothetical protein A2010_12060 [Nitrospirae bacterium GWD2_57_9]|nr:MAG: hypothetical protein A2010_12060 [Nitrospirae bacterium GWD2_57_9]OGW46138.1 MAG: hypothetical protein A2078_12240 [Nitrospirae bacterium GWC2_57_9]
MNKHTGKIWLFLFLVTAAAAIRFSPAGDLLAIDNLKRYPDLLRGTVQDHYPVSIAAFIGIYIAVTGLSLPGATILTLAAGFLYGTLPATLYVNVGATAGAVLSFLSARYLLGNWLQAKYERQLLRFNEETNRSGSRYLITLRLVPAFPSFPINILAGFTRVPLRTFVWTTLIGIIPGTAVFAFAGEQVLSLDSPEDILSGRILTAFALLAFFALLPAFIDRLRSSKQRPEGESSGGKKELPWTKKRK